MSVPKSWYIGHQRSCSHNSKLVLCSAACFADPRDNAELWDSGLQALKAANVDFIVAPFEADAQMAYLAVNGLVHAVITEDSDLLPYGCPRVRCTLMQSEPNLCMTQRHSAPPA